MHVNRWQTKKKKKQESPPPAADSADYGGDRVARIPDAPSVFAYRPSLIPVYAY
jgi:hypothetical protein